MSLTRKIHRKEEKEKQKYIADVRGEAKKIAQTVVDKAMARAYNEAYQEAYKEAINEAAETAIAKVMAVAAEIIYNDYGKLNKKDTRLKIFAEQFQTKLELIENPTEKQLEVERLLEEQCGIRFGRKDNLPDSYAPCDGRTIPKPCLMPNPDL